MKFIRFKIIVVVLITTIIISCHRNHKNAVIGIQPLGDFPEYLMDTIKQDYEMFFNRKVVVLNKTDIPQSTFVNIKSPRYRADLLIRHLRKNKPDSIDYIVGLTAKDISITKKDKNGNIKKPESKYRDFGIFGLGFCPGTSCIVSTFRLKNTTDEKFMIRFRKICIHELGHNMGLPHCENSEICVMRDAAESIRTIDKVDLGFCESCMKKL
jgi:archaemetzincin